MIPGVMVEMGGQQWTVPPLTLGQLRRLMPKVQQLTEIELLHHFIAKLRQASEESDGEVERPSHRLRRPRGDAVGNIKKE